MVPELDQSQLAFCRSRDENIRLLAPAGCGKTASLLYRCLEIARNARSRPRFLIITFTRSAVAELTERLINDRHFAGLSERTTVNTLNAYGYRRIRDKVRSNKLLTSKNDYHFAMLNQLRPVWQGNSYIEPVVTKRGNNARRLMEVMDNLKSMGFDHTEDTNLRLFRKRLSDLSEQGLSWRIDEQFEILTRIGVLESPKKGEQEGPATSHRQFYDRFFTFWRKAVQNLLEQSTFTFEDQKYWTYLELKSPGPDGKRRSYITGAARYSHVLVDEFQDINPLDLLLIKAIADRNRAKMTIRRYSSGAARHPNTYCIPITISRHRSKTTCCKSTIDLLKT